MSRLYRTGAFNNNATVGTNTATIHAVPMRLAKKKIALVKKVVFSIVDSNGTPIDNTIVLMGLINRPIKNVADADIGSLTQIAESGFRDNSYVAVAIGGVKFVAAAFFQQVLWPSVLDFQEPFPQSTGDMTLVVAGNASQTVMAGVQVWYEQKQVSDEVWRGLAKEY